MGIIENIRNGILEKSGHNEKMRQMSFEYCPNCEKNVKAITLFLDLEIAYLWRCPICSNVHLIKYYKVKRG